MNFDFLKSGGLPVALSCLRFPRGAAWRRGQILIPSILVIPSLILFIYLILETTKLSRGKIRQQFAVDSAAFIQMGDYTNILNRTAYVNGAFPYRIFKEAYECTGGCSSGTEDNCMKKTDDTGTICTYKMLYDAGAIPKYDGDVEFELPDDVKMDKEPQWKIAFNETTRGNMKNNPPAPADTLALTTTPPADRIYFFWDPALGVYQMYAMVYSMLGAVEESQMTVFERLTENFNFFRKSYFLNASTDDCVANPNLCGEEGIGSPGGFKINKFGAHGHNSAGTIMSMWYVRYLTFSAKVPKPGLPPYEQSKANPVDMTSVHPQGLFQLATFSDSALTTIGDGYHVYQGWDIPENYFGVDFKSKAACKETGRPCVHALVASQCPQLGSGNNCVWPSPTPKYQTRLYP